MANTIKIKNSGTASAVPSSLEYGELGLNYADGKIYFKNSSNVIVDYGTVIGGATGASVTVSDTAPEGAGVGDIWYESDTGKMFVYYDSFWVEASGSDGIGVTGATGATGTVDLASPAFTGTPTAPTAAAGTNTTQLATTEFVTTAAAGVTSGFRNKTINGNMAISQRGTSAISNAAATNTYGTDRWHIFGSSASTMTITQSTTNPTGQGFSNSTLVTSSAATTPASGDYYGVRQYIEGYNMADLAWGTSGAKPIVVSFWVRSSIAGTYSLALHNGSGNRSLVSTYTISAVDTWEKKTIYINAGDITGTWATDNSIGLAVWFDLGSGTSANGTAGAWTAGLPTRTSGSSNWVGTSGATFYITGVQLEQNYQPTPFEQLPIGLELELCQRYYYRTGGGVSSDIYLAGYQPASTNIIFTYFHPVTMRATPSLASKVGTWLLINTASQPIIGGASTTSYYAYITVNAGITNANQSGAYTNNSTTYFEFSSEL